MKNIFILFAALLLGCFPLSAQEDQKPRQTVEQMPQFPGGEKALFEYIGKNLKYPTEAHTKGIQGRVIVRFIVGADGKPTSIQVVKGVDPLLDSEATRVIASMPAWIPGRDKGVAVPVYFTLPIMYKLNDQKSVDQSKFVVIIGEEVSKPNVEGIWQVALDCKKTNDGMYSAIPGPIIKILSSDNKFFTLYPLSNNSPSVMTMNGTYKQTSDSTYVEKIQNSINPSLNSKEVILTFKLLNSNLIQFTFIMPGSDKIYTEHWIRVSEPHMYGKPLTNTTGNTALIDKEL